MHCRPPHAPARLAALALALAACRETAPAPTGPARPALDAATPDAPAEAAPVDAGAPLADAPLADAPSPLRDACEALTRASLARWNANFSPPERARWPQFARWSCAPAADGAWALTLDGRTLGVAFVAPDGAVARLPLNSCSLQETNPSDSPYFFIEDRDGDGRTEVLLHCVDGRAQAIVRGAAGLAPSPLPFAGASVDLVDVDRDGRTDLVGHFGALDEQDFGLVADALPDAELIFVAHAAPLRFVAHALPGGGFSLDDEVARVVLRGQCPERPTSLLLPQDEDLDENSHEEAITRRVMCARVWGVPVAEIAALIDRAEAEGEPPRRFNGSRPRVAAGDGGVRFPLPRAALLRVAENARPPLRLRPVRLPAVAALPDPPDAGPDEDEDETHDFDLVADAGPDAGADAGDAAVVPALPAAAARACAAAAERVRRLTQAEVRRSGEVTRDDDESPGWVTRQMGHLRETLGRCVAARGGAWVLALRSLGRGRSVDGDKPALHARWAADFIAADGARVEGPAQGPLVIDSCDEDEARVLGASDFDGDGRGELAVGNVHHNCIDPDHPLPTRVFTARDGRVAPYAPFDTVGGVQSVTDFDRDGRLDFVEDNRWHNLYPSYCSRHVVNSAGRHGPPTLWHARPDGTFSRNDGAARAFARACAPPARIYATSRGNDWSLWEGTDALFRAVCARAHGWSAERVQLQALAELRSSGSYGSFCDGLEWLSWRLVIPPAPFAP